MPEGSDLGSATVGQLLIPVENLERAITSRHDPLAPLVQYLVESRDPHAHRWIRHPRDAPVASENAEREVSSAPIARRINSAYWRAASSNGG